MKELRDYIIQSLELHLFFARIMKEHSLFLEAGFQIKDTELIEKAKWFREQFEQLLCETVEFSNGLVRSEVLNSGEIVTKFTLDAEKKTECLTGISIDSHITRLELELEPLCGRCNKMEHQRKVRSINQRAIRLVSGLIRFKEAILSEVEKCCLFTANYPLLIKHILREARLYLSYVRELENRGFICDENMRSVELFWNQIMMEHALFIRGLLDPTECELIASADGFAKEYACLLEEVDRKNCLSQELTQKTLEETMKYRDFKATGTNGIIKCEISSLILPLLGGHVLREANHYIRLLEE